VITHSLSIQSKLRFTRVLGGAALLLASTAHAQEATPAPAPAPAAAEPAKPADASGGFSFGFSSSDGASADADADANAPEAAAPAADGAGEPQVSDGGPLGQMSFMAFVDANYAYSTQRSGSAQPVHRAYETNTGDFATHNGFNLSWFGVDVGYETGDIWESGTVGATGSLRFGSAVPVYMAGNQTDLGIENLTQAYATWKPNPCWTLDFGQFNTIYGGEVTESWKNLNYTRGGLYYLMQPFFHTGMRASYTLNEDLTFTGLVVNGVNNTVDTNGSPSVGLQIAHSGEKHLVSAGYLGALGPKSDHGNFDNFFDVVGALYLDKFTLMLNADLAFSLFRAIDTDAAGRIIRVIDTPTYGGVALTAGYQFTPQFGAAIRGEFLQDTHNRLYQFRRDKRVNLTTATLTLDAKPVEGADNFIIRWDNRLEVSNHDIFATKKGAETEKYFESIVGVVVHTND
jgi:hypothetical protein